jgi:hypothetical protein
MRESRRLDTSRSTPRPTRAFACVLTWALALVIALTVAPTTTANEAVGLPPGLELSKLDPAPAAEAKTPEDDADAPIVLVLPAEASDRGAIRLKARVEDAGGVAQVKAWVLDPHESDYRPVFMSAVKAPVYQALIQTEPGTDRPLTYYVEATDGVGNTTVSGSADSPFVVNLDQLPGLQDEATTRQRTLLAIVAVSGAFLLIGLAWFGLHAPVEMAERRFWLHVLAPASQAEGLELVRAVDNLCSRWHDYPDRGRIRITKEQAFYWMGVLKMTEASALRRERIRGCVDGQTDDTARIERTRQAESDLFWIHLLARILPLEGDEANAAMADLAGKPHAHPHDGIQNYDVRILRKRLDWARTTGPDEVVARWKEAHLPEAEFKKALEETDRTTRPSAEVDWKAGQTPAERELSSQSGATLMELLGAVALLGSIATVGGLYLRPAEAPLTSAGDVVEATFKQARARAVSTTSAVPRRSRTTARSTPRRSRRGSRRTSTCLRWTSSSCSSACTASPT